MPIFQATIQHDDKTFESLAHMQYDLFCKSNRISRTILSVAAILIGIIGITIEKVIKFLEKKLTGWQETREV